MSIGTITKLVTTFGSNWGRIGVPGSERQVFFNTASMADPHGFAELRQGQQVEFEEVVDQVNGSHATEMTISKARQVN